MGILVSCESCDTEFSASSKAAGKRVKCPACGEAVRVPMDEDDSPSLSRRSAPGRSSNRSRGSKTAQNSSGLLIGLGVGGGTVAVLGLVFVLISRGSGGGNIPAAPTNSQAMTTAPVQQQQGQVPPQQSSISQTPQTPPQAAGTQIAGVNRPQQGSIPMPPFDAKPPATGAPNSNPATVVVEKPASAPQSDEEAPLKDLNMTDLVALVEQSVVRIIVRSDVGASVGSGFVIDTAGLIMTNYHVIEGAKSAFVEFETGKKANVTGFTTIDQERDLAIIKIDYDSKELHKIRVAKDLPKKGEKVAAFGAPRGLSFTASDGIISAIRHTPEFNARTEGTYLQTTAPISPGNSGGPLVNMRGEVVGVNSFKIEGENLNFAASSNDIRDVIANKGDAVTALSPEALPTKYTDKAAGRAEDLSGTTKGRMLLAQIRDVAIVMLPFTFDPSGRFSDFVENQVESKLTKGCGWTKVTRQSQFKNSTAVVVVLIYFRVAENVEKADEKGVSELMCRIRIVARDVDKDGEAYAAIVWNEDGALGTISLQSLATGFVTDNMKKKVGEFFVKLVSAYKKAKRDAEAGKLN